ncbi:MOSC domain containing protein [Pedosphaera parvula Ellin514]|uniref:MOSC domain containing protein n=2 Tax=Pedosphaera TaxID=1032526 RepID=B9XDS1_PEDPL|nr:MOSC domain containing protein [Pedosphaera parvula Ellin514]
MIGGSSICTLNVVQSNRLNLPNNWKVSLLRHRWWQQLRIDFKPGCVETGTNALVTLGWYLRFEQDSKVMKVLSINVSLPREVTGQGKTFSTGIFKIPVEGRIKVHSLGLEGDGQADLENHGGIHKAVYSYPFEHYEYWAGELGRNDFSFGQFGENLTISGWLEDGVHIGDMFRIGEVLLEISQPRVPCYKLAVKMNLPEFPKHFAASGRIGFYLRVLAPGEIGAGDAMERVKIDSRGVTVREMMDVMYFKRHNEEIMRKAITIPALTPSWRDELKQRLGMEAVTNQS